MSSHLACIGVPTEDSDDLAELAVELARKGDLAAGPAGARVIIWRDGSGAGLVFNLNQGHEILCVAPTFAATSRIRFVGTNVAEDGDCSFCDQIVGDVVGSRGEPLFALPFQAEDMGLTRNLIPLKERLTVALTAFAESIEVWPNEDAFRAEHPELDSPIESATAAGVREAEGERLVLPRARLLMRARVTRSETRRNSATGGAFVHSFVRTDGVSFDMLSSLRETPESLPVGGIVEGQFWLVGRVVTGLRGKARWTWVGRLFDR